eukprot:4973203-Amphidinium_carterae.1
MVFPACGPKLVNNNVFPHHERSNALLATNHKARPEVRLSRAEVNYHPHDYGLERTSLKHPDQKVYDRMRASLVMRKAFINEKTFVARKESPND